MVIDSSATRRDEDIDAGHTVQFYADDAYLIGGLTDKVASALRAGDAVLIVATQAHRVELLRHLGLAGIDIDGAAGQGRCVTLDAAETLASFTVDGRLDVEAFTAIIGSHIANAKRAATSDGRRVLIFGEMVALLWSAGKREAAVQLENFWNDLTSTHAFSLTCAYPMRQFEQADDDVLFQSICAAHTHVLPTEAYMALDTLNEQRRAVAHLELKARALETELREHERTQAELRQRNEELRAALVVRDRFLANAAHALQTPVTSLRGVAQLLLRSLQSRGEVTQTRLESALRTIDTQTNELRLLTARLLDSANIEAGAFRIDPVATDLARLVRAKIARHPARTTHHISYEGVSHLEACVDQARFEQVLADLLSNAVKFSPHASTITVRLDQETDGVARLSVTDQGIGIPAEHRAQVFERFHQVQDNHHRAGMGLGLYTTSEIVRLHGGEIRIEEPERGGTRMVVNLPGVCDPARPASTAP